MTKNGVREFTGDVVEGGIVGAFRIYEHDLEIKVSRSADRPFVQIIPRNSSEESLRVVQATHVRQNGRRLSVTLPASSFAWCQRIHQWRWFENGVHYRGPVTIRNGVIYSGAATEMAMNSGVLVKVTLPVGSSADIKSVSGDVNIKGNLDDLQFASVSGELTAAMVRTVKVNTTSGDVELTGVWENGSITTASGAVEITNYEGEQLSVNTVSGDVELTAGWEAKGHISVRTIDGDITTRNTRNRKDLEVIPRTVSGDIRK